MRDFANDVIAVSAPKCKTVLIKGRIKAVEWMEAIAMTKLGLSLDQARQVTKGDSELRKFIEGSLDFCDFFNGGEVLCRADVVAIP